jgi:hypothetical protein
MKIYDKHEEKMNNYLKAFFGKVNSLGTNGRPETKYCI